MESALVMNSLAGLVPLERYIEAPTLPTAESSTSGSSRSHNHCFSDEDLTNYPWLAQYVQPSQAARMSSGAQEAQSRQLPAEPATEVQDVLAEAVERLKAKRLARSVDAPDDTLHYVITVRGGRWTQYFRSVPADSVMVQAKSKQALDFSQKFGLTKIATFSFALYGEHGADRLAQLWANRMHQLLQSALENPDIAQVSDLPVQILEPEWVASFLSANADNARLLKRAAEIRSIG